MIVAMGRAPQRRSERAHEAVLRAADDLLVERGYAGVTIEGIAARAGVAKQTIYRWWPSKFEILMDTFAEDAESALKVPDTGSTTEDLRQHLHQLAGFLTEHPPARSCSLSSAKHSTTRPWPRRSSSAT